MRTALDASPDDFDEAEQSFVAKIREHGWFRTAVMADDEGPAFSFTTGFRVSANHPEVIIFSMRDDIAHDVFWDLFRDAQDAKALSVGKRTDAVFGNAPAYVFRVAKRHFRNFLGWSFWFYGSDDFPCLQIVWPDGTGLFPWERGFDASFQASQTDLTEKGWVNEIID